MVLLTPCRRCSQYVRCAAAAARSFALRSCRHTTESPRFDNLRPLAILRPDDPKRQGPKVDKVESERPLTDHRALEVVTGIMDGDSEEASFEKLESAMRAIALREGWE